MNTGDTSMPLTKASSNRNSKATQMKTRVKTIVSVTCDLNLGGTTKFHTTLIYSQSNVGLAAVYIMKA